MHSPIIKVCFSSKKMENKRLSKISLPYNSFDNLVFVVRGYEIKLYLLAKSLICVPNILFEAEFGYTRIISSGHRYCFLVNFMDE